MLTAVDGAGSEHWLTYTGRTSDPDPSSQSRLQTISESAWDAVTSDGNNPFFDYLSQDLFTVIDMLAMDILQSTDYFAAAGTPIWDDLILKYFKQLPAKFKSHIQPESSTDTINITIKLALIRKLEWMSHHHGDLHYAPILPLVTPKVLDCISQAFQQIPNALTEVCTKHNYIYLYI